MSVNVEQIARDAAKELNKAHLFIRLGTRRFEKFAEVVLLSVIHRAIQEWKDENAICDDIKRIETDLSDLTDTLTPWTWPQQSVRYALAPLLLAAIVGWLLLCKLFGIRDRYPQAEERGVTG